jgi:hypothetical protein
MIATRSSLTPAQRCNLAISIVTFWPDLNWSLFHMFFCAIIINITLFGKQAVVRFLLLNANAILPQPFLTYHHPSLVRDTPIICAVPHSHSITIQLWCTIVHYFSVCNTLFTTMLVCMV